MEVAGFDWDQANTSKCLSHGLSIKEIEALFRSTPRVAPDPSHSATEDRLIAIGHSKKRPAAVRGFYDADKRRAGDLFGPSAPAICVQERSEIMKRKIPKLTTDEEAEAFLAQDLSDLDISQFKPVRFEFEKKTAQINMRLPKPLLDAVKRHSSARGIPYTRFIREALEMALARSEKSR